MVLPAPVVLAVARTMLNGFPVCMVRMGASFHPLTRRLPFKGRAEMGFATKRGRGSKSELARLLKKFEVSCTIIPALFRDTSSVGGGEVLHAVNCNPFGT